MSRHCDRSQQNKTKHFSETKIYFKTDFSDGILNFSQPNFFLNAKPKPNWGGLEPRPSFIECVSN